VSDRPQSSPGTFGSFRDLAHDGDPDLVREIFTLFTRDTPRRLRALREAAAAGDLEAVRFTAHALHGSSASLGAQEMAQVCRTLEDGVGLEEDPARVEALIDALEQRVAEVTAVLSQGARSR
jgi:HPt (histidine-containing phosphotransfer) domain-containing protein